MPKTLLLMGVLLISTSCSKTTVVSADKVCNHVATIAETSVENCLKDMEKLKTELGKEKFEEFSNCVVKTKQKNDLAACVPKEDMQTYVNKSKATEAKVSLRMLADSVRAYYLSPPMEGGLDLAPSAPTLPESVGPTPAKGSCCGDLGKCAPDIELWEAPTWLLLSFAMYDPHYYSYEYKRHDDGKGFVVSAYGDLDCDGTFSTFTLAGNVGADGEVTLGELEGKDEQE